MKKLILSALACIALVISSCNQNSPAPSPATPTPTPAPTPTSSMTATEALLVGDWIWDKTELYTNGNLSYIHTPSTFQSSSGAATTNTLYAGSHMVLKSSFWNGTATTNSLVPQFYNADYYSYQSGSSFWQVKPLATGDQLFTNGYGIPYCNLGNIITLNSTNLVVQGWLPGQIPSGSKCFYHK